MIDDNVRQCVIEEYFRELIKPVYYLGQEAFRLEEDGVIQFIPCYMIGKIKKIDKNFDLFKIWVSDEMNKRMLHPKLGGCTFRWVTNLYEWDKNSGCAGFSEIEDDEWLLAGTRAATDALKNLKKEKNDGSY